ncbi:MAG: BrnA antitoxin family protein [Tabrizicola sp.]|nr:BrnA antitoxin family protein [Tabrizicola sp.]
MPDLKKQTPRQRAHMTYMMDVMRRLEWDLHNTIEATGRIPAEWHEIARATPRAATVKVTLSLDADVVKFFKSMGQGYGPRINDVLRSYLHARLAGVIRGAETVAHFRRREAEGLDGPKPAFGDTARAMGEAWQDEGPPVAQPSRAQMQEIRQRRFAEEGGNWDDALPWVR